MGLWERVTGRTMSERNQPVAPGAVEVEHPVTTEPAPPPAPVTEYRSYVVQLGDRVEDLATSHGVTVAELAAANELQHPDRIWPGMQLRVPAS